MWDCSCHANYISHGPKGQYPCKKELVKDEQAGSMCQWAKTSVDISFDKVFGKSKTKKKTKHKTQNTKDWEYSSFLLVCDAQTKPERKNKKLFFFFCSFFKAFCDHLDEVFLDSTTDSVSLQESWYAWHASSADAHPSGLFNLAFSQVLFSCLHLTVT